MKKLNKSIFDIFNKEDKEVYKEHDVVIKFNNASYVLGDFIKAFENYYILNQIQSEQYGSQYTQVKSKIKHKYFVKLVNSLKRIDLVETPSIEKAAKEHDYTKLLNMLDGLRGYFENREEYERCAVIKKYIDACLLSDGPLHTLELSDYDIQSLLNRT